MCALARTTPTTFVYMGGDVCHHGGEMRPTPYLPLPKNLDPSLVPRLAAGCPGSEYVEIHPKHDPTKPFYRMAENFPDDFADAEWSLEGTEEFDGSEDVLVCMAHDESLVDALEWWPKPLGDWKEKGLAAKARWAFLGDFDVGRRK